MAVSAKTQTREHWLEVSLGIAALIVIGWYVLKSLQTTVATQAQATADVPVTAGVAGYGYYWPGQYGPPASDTLSSGSVTAPGIGLNASGGAGGNITINTTGLQQPPSVPSWTYTGYAPGGMGVGCCCEPTAG
jgi:hypothetical protein